MPRNHDWAIRDDRTLGAYAKLAVFVLRSREPDIRPSMGLLAADMGVSVRTAQRAVRELERRGWLSIRRRFTEHGDPDAHEYRLTIPGGGVLQSPGVVPEGHEGGDCPADKDSNLKTPTLKGQNGSASRHAHAAKRAVFRSEQEQVALVRRAVIVSYDPGDNDNLSDDEALDIWARFVGDRLVQDPVSYLSRIFEDFPYLDGVLSNTPERDIA